MITSTLRMNHLLSGYELSSFRKRVADIGDMAAYLGVDESEYRKIEESDLLTEKQSDMAIYLMHFHTLCVQGLAHYLIAVSQTEIFWAGKFGLDSHPIVFMPVYRPEHIDHVKRDFGFLVYDLGQKLDFADTYVDRINNGLKVSFINDVYATAGGVVANNIKGLCLPVLFDTGSYIKFIAQNKNEGIESKIMFASHRHFERYANKKMLNQLALDETVWAERNKEVRGSGTEVVFHGIKFNVMRSGDSIHINLAEPVNMPPEQLNMIASSLIYNINVIKKSQGVDAVFKMLRQESVSPQSMSNQNLINNAGPYVAELVNRSLFLVHIDSKQKTPDTVAFDEHIHLKFPKLN